MSYEVLYKVKHKLSNFWLKSGRGRTTWLKKSGFSQIPYYANYKDRYEVIEYLLIPKNEIVDNTSTRKFIENFWVKHFTYIREELSEKFPDIHVDEVELINYQLHNGYTNFILNYKDRYFMFSTFPNMFGVITYSQLGLLECEIKLVASYEFVIKGKQNETSK